MKSFAEFMACIAETTLVRIMDDYVEFEKNGMIGDCDMRTVATAVCKYLGSGFTAYWMLEVAHYAHRHFAYKYIEEHNL